MYVCSCAPAVSVPSSASDHELPTLVSVCAKPNQQIEESYISAEEFCRAARQEASVVLKGEVGVLQVCG